MSWVLLGIAIVGFVELARRFQILRALLGMTGLVAKVSHTVRSAGISDHWKERVLLIYAHQLLVLSVKSFLLVVCCLSPALIIAVLAHGLGAEVGADWASWSAFLGGTLFAFTYVHLRKMIVN